MNALRSTFSVGAAVLLILGYFASQVSYFQGDPSGYAARVDQSPVHMLAAIFFIAALILSLIPDRAGERA